MRPAVFLDRDDTLIATREATRDTAWPGDLSDPELVRLLPGVPEGLALLGGAGLALVVVSNQGGVSRGACTLGQVRATNQRLRELVRREAGVELDGLYFCPHHPGGSVSPWNTEHPWRKPAPGMILAAATDLELDLTRSWLIGDGERDIAAGVAAGIPRERAVLLGTDEPDFLSAARRVLTAEGRG
ncbi:MAG TPA: HAD-IIIA family hydrolase [Phycisphaerales bacterium]|nr:HAD-IIIA family hydrolase [Phycisphaerales bacterium]